MKPAAADRIAEPQLRFPHGAKGGNLYPVKCGLIVFCMPKTARRRKGGEGEWLPQINGQTAVKTLKYTRDICLNVANFG